MIKNDKYYYIIIRNIMLWYSSTNQKQSLKQWKWLQKHKHDNESIAYFSKCYPVKVGFGDIDENQSKSEITLTLRYDSNGE